MNIDSFGLPVQLDRDASDQLQRVGMLAISNQLIGQYSIQYDAALRNILQTTPGRYKRHSTATTDLDTTGDQLIPTIAYWALVNHSELSLMWRRLFFAQNTRKQGEITIRTFPDFMVFRALPLFIRATEVIYPIVLLLDILLVLASSTYVLLNRKLDNVDDNNLIVTLAVCQAIRPTLLSTLACRIYKNFRAINFGSVNCQIHPIIGALRWYHRAEWPSYGNPEIARLWEPVVLKYIIY